jgi:hypothetical protein
VVLTLWSPVGSNFISSRNAVVIGSSFLILSRSSALFLIASSNFRCSLAKRLEARAPVAQKINGGPSVITDKTRILSDDMTVIRVYLLRIAAITARMIGHAYIAGFAHISTFVAVVFDPATDSADAQRLSNSASKGSIEFCADRQQLQQPGRTIAAGGDSEHTTITFPGCLMSRITHYYD